MVRDAPFSVSAIQAGLSAVRLAKQHDISPFEATKLLRRLSMTLDFESAARIAEQFSWDTFVPQESRVGELRDTLASLSRVLSPYWAQASVYGRRKAIQFMDQDALQVFEYAGLLGEPVTSDVVEWWDKLSSRFRSIGDDAKLRTGRRAEKLTIEFEESRLRELSCDLKPEWVGFENSTLGYDVLSYEASSDNKFLPIFIEVKGYQSIQRFFLTSNEWMFAVRNRERARLHVWNLSSDKLDVYTIDELGAHIPINCGAGEWRTSELRLTRQE